MPPTFLIRTSLWRWGMVLILMTGAKSLLVRVCAPGKQSSTRQWISWDAGFYLRTTISMRGPKNQQPATSFVMSYSGRVITGLEMRCAAELGCSAAMGAPGNPALALRRSIDKGMQPNKAGQHVNYLEIYEPDVLADEMQSVLRYGASLFVQKDP